MKKIKIKAICGKAGSGKDTILREVIKAFPQNNKIINCTTRPIRENETNGINYHFLTIPEFTDKLINGKIIEASEFNNWFYGTDIETLSQSNTNIGVFNPTGIEILMENPSIDLTIFLIEATDKNRLLRQLNREENPDVKEIVRRFSADEKDFNHFELFASPIVLHNNSKEDLEYAVKVIGSEENI